MSETTDAWNGRGGALPVNQTHHTTGSGQFSRQHKIRISSTIRIHPDILVPMRETVRIVTTEEDPFTLI